METGITVDELQSFEKEIFELFQNGKIKSPVHLRTGNEEQLIEIFRDIKEEDFCLFTWASHLEHNIISSAIVGGNAPLAVGMAMGYKKRNENRKVWCFVGDMAFYTGTVLESLRYAEVHDLPITFVVADNRISVKTPTREIWGDDIEKITQESPKCIRYEYVNSYPHAGTGEKVLF